MISSMKLAGALVVLALVGCRATQASEAPVSIATPIRDVMRLEDMRTIGEQGELLQLLQHANASVRARAATAVGRLKFPCAGQVATAKLGALLRDPEADVRVSAAFALGMREDPSVCEELIDLGTGAQRDKSDLVRARALEAASKLNRPDLASFFLVGLSDPSADVRIEAAAGAARWKTDAPNAGEVNERLAVFVAKETDLRARIYGLFALERRKAAEGRAAFLGSARATEVDEQLFAVRGLANLAGDPEVDAALIEASRHSDWRIAVEALRGLATSQSAIPNEAIARALGNTNFHVRATALGTVTAMDAHIHATLLTDARHRENFKLLPSDPSASVRAAAMLNSILRMSLELRGSWRPDPSAHVRAALLQGRAMDFAQDWMVDALEGAGRHSGLFADEADLLVRGARVSALAERPDPEATAPQLFSLGEMDNGLRLAAVTALLGQRSPMVSDDWLERWYETSDGEVSTEVRFNVLRLAAKIGGAAAPQLLTRGLDDPDAFVRRTAREELQKLTGAQIPWVDRPVPEVELGFPGEGLLANPRPHVVIATSRGEMEFVLFADETPQHVLNFMKHVDFYKGTTFHRVVSDFVAQGGDARGDGNGGSSWRGDSLRHEISPRKYVRGSLGMPRNEDWDSGGSQIFVTHRPTPHLDGRYTIFGELVKGFDVLDALDLGDVILEVRVQD